MTVHLRFLAPLTAPNKILLVLMLCSSTALFSQSMDRSVIGTAGNSRNSATFSVDWTIGEAIVNTLSNDNTVLTQGFHQIEWIVLETPQVVQQFNDLRIYPNPAGSFVNLASSKPISGIVQLMTMNGQEAERYEITQEKTTTKIDLSRLSGSNYLLIVYDEKGQLLKTFNLLKSY